MTPKPDGLPGTPVDNTLKAAVPKVNVIEEAAKNLLANRLGAADAQVPGAHRPFWYELAVAIYGKDSQHAKALEG